MQLAQVRARLPALRQPSLDNLAALASFEGIPLDIPSVACTQGAEHSLADIAGIVEACIRRASDTLEASFQDIRDTPADTPVPLVAAADTAAVPQLQ